MASRPLRPDPDRDTDGDRTDQAGQPDPFPNPHGSVLYDRHVRDRYPRDDAGRSRRDDPTGDIWLFKGSTLADRTIRAATNSPVNHVGMAVAIDDLPPLMWHAELGQSLPDVWTGEHQRGTQLHKLATLSGGSNRYGQRGWMRQIDTEVTRSREDALARDRRS